MYYSEYQSPLGPLLLLSDGVCLTGLYMDVRPSEAIRREEVPVLEQTRRWLDGYFRGDRPETDLPLCPEGTAFQKCIWQLLREIPYGETITYGALAAEAARILGKERMSAQAVGNAVGRNPVSILVPCHRVVGAGGKLTGYAWGLERKAWLLAHEKGETK